MPRARQAQKKTTRERILEAACGEFARRGISSTRVDDVAKACGVSHGTVFLHFKTQEALTCEVIDTTCGRIAAHTHELAEHGGSLRSVLEAHLKGIAEFEPFYARLLMEAGGLPEECRAAWLSLQSAVSLHLNRAAVREASEGEIKSLPEAFLFNAWMGLVAWYLMNGELFAPGGSVVGRHGETLVDNFMKLVSRD